MEPSKIAPNNHEHTKWLVRVFDVRQEPAIEAEGKRDFSRLVEVGLEDVLVEEEERLEDLEIMLVRDRLPDLVVQLLVREWSLRLESLVGERRHQLACVVIRVVDHRKVDVEHSYLSTHVSRPLARSYSRLRGKNARDRGTPRWPRRYPAW
jgi:hypothetical protein